ncbi:MAG: ABC transporter ATP-binding protein [Candidatus Binatia bacterium]|nr:MAG: ABC transporter ATP-binding protein [Candidatus Binatia bacterium]
MRRLFGYLARYRWRYALGGLCLLGTATLAMAVPYLLKRAVDTVAAGGPLREVTRYALVIVAIALVQGVVRTFSRFVVFNAGRDVEYDLRNDLFAHLVRLPPSFYQRERTGDLMSRLVNDVAAVRLLLGPGILNLVNTPLYYAYAVSIMLSLDARLTVVALLPYPVLLLAVRFYSREMMEQTYRVQSGLADLSSRVQEAVSGLSVIKAYARESYEEEKFDEINRAFTRESLRLARIRGQMFPLMKVASSLGTLVLLWYGGSRVVRGSMTLGDLVAFIGYLNMLAWPTMALGWMISIVQRGRAAMLRLEHIFRVEPEIRDPADPRPLGEVLGEIRFDHVDFAYPGSGNGRPVLRDIDLRIRPGQKVAVVGKTGAGKTTLLWLLPRLYDPAAGRVLVDGEDVRSVPLSELRRAIGCVPQDPFLFSTTIRENIAFGDEEIDDERVEAAAKAAGVDQDIAAFPHGYETLVGERGITLSGGQRQRITLARALYADPRILLLDDALSSVDTRTEQRILVRLRDWVRGRTTIVVSHRLSAVQDADLVAVLDEGRLVEIGRHEELLARGGLYAEIFRRQRIEEELSEL